MRMMTAAAALMAALSFSHAAEAAEAGKWQVKLLGTAVLPDGEIDKIKYADPAVAAALAPLDVLRHAA